MFRLSRNIVSVTSKRTGAISNQLFIRSNTAVASSSLNTPNSVFACMSNNKLSFSTTTSTRYSHGQGDHELVHSLEKELKYEQEALGESQEESTQLLAEFKKRGTFELIDTPGEKEVKLVRQFGNEKITVLFSTDALADAEEMMDEDGAENTEEQIASYPVNLTVLIQKPDIGTMELSVVMEGDSFFIENSAFGKDSKLMTEESAEADWNRRGLYGGPVFAELDETLQDRFHQFLEERGFDSALADFIPNYIEHKEQKEYMRWLDSVAKFVAK